MKQTKYDNHWTEDEILSFHYDKHYIGIGTMRKLLKGKFVPKDTIRNMEINMKEIMEEKKIINKMNKRSMIELNKSIEEARKKAKLKDSKGVIYLLKSIDLYKIGRTKNFKKRFRTYKTENPHGVRLIFKKETLDCQRIEKMLLEKFKDKQVRGEWFKLNRQEFISYFKEVSEKVK